MNITHLFKNVFNSDTAKVYKAGAEQPKAAEKAEKQKLSPAEMQKELTAVAKRHIDNAKKVVKEVEKYLGKAPTGTPWEQMTGHKGKIFSALNKVKANVTKLEKAVRSGKVTMNLLEQSKRTMRKHVGNISKRMSTYRAGDPLQKGMLVSYNASHYESDINVPETVAKAQQDVFKAADHFTRYAPSGGSWAGYGMSQTYNRELAELAAARQLKRNRGELPKEKDANLQLAKEVSDAIRLSQAVTQGKYNQEKPKTVLAREARLTERLLRKTGAMKLAPGGVKDLGFVVIQKSNKVDGAYLLSVAEGGTYNGRSIAIPVTTIIDTKFEERAKKAKGKKVETADYDDFPANAERNASKVATRMQKKLEETA